MTELLVTYTLKDRSSRDGFYGEITQNRVGELSRAEAGCLVYEYFFPCEKENVLFLLERWEDEPSRAAHGASAHFALLGALKRKYGAETALEIRQDM